MIEACLRHGWGRMICRINIFGYFLGSVDVIITVVLFRKVPGRGIDKVSAARLSAQLLPRRTELVRSNGR
jgi:hypothetical protein